MRVIQKICQAYGIKLNQILPREQGYRNKIYPVITNLGQKLAIVIYKAETDILQKIKNANSVSNYLANHGFLTRQNLKHQDKAIIKISSIGSPVKHYACVYNYLAGATIPWESYSMKHLKLLGKTLAKMHQTLVKIPIGKARKIGLQTIDLELERILQDMISYLSKKSVQKALAKKLQIRFNLNLWKNFTKLITFIKKQKNPQILHLDFVRSNVLFDVSPTGELFISGILDFEKTALGPVIVDLARTLSFLLIDTKYKTHPKIIKYFLRSGYQKHSQTQLQNLSLLKPLMIFFLCYDVYKFLLHNPYESLPQNEHYLRTISYLRTHAANLFFD